MSKKRTSKNIVLVVLIRLRTDFDEALETVVVDELVYEILIILQPTTQQAQLTSQCRSTLNTPRRQRVMNGSLNKIISPI